MSNFITDIKINKVRHLENIDIKLGDTKKHLILTGKNGSGKTSVLEELNKFISDIVNNDLIEINTNPSKERLFYEIDGNRYNLYPNITNIHSLYLKFMENTKIDFIYAFFPAKRRDKKMIEPRGAKKLELPTDKNAKLNDYFLQYLVNMNIDLLFAKVEEEKEEIEVLNKWFTQFENMMKQIFDDSFKISLDRKKGYTFWIERDKREPFTFNTLSAGYASIIDVVSEILMKIETTESKSFNCEGIVLIDEIDTHLHVEMQKNIMPLLTSFFPNIQFIVTTHSPFILSSIENAVIYDLENKLRVEDLSEASYSGLIRNYFGISSEYSNVLEEKFNEFEILVKRDDLTEKEEDRLIELDVDFKNATPLLSSELYLKYIALRREFLV